MRYYQDNHLKENRNSFKRTRFNCNNLNTVSEYVDIK